MRLEAVVAYYKKPQRHLVREAEQGYENLSWSVGLCAEVRGQSLPNT